MRISKGVEYGSRRSSGRKIKMIEVGGEDVLSRHEVSDRQFIGPAISIIGQELGIRLKGQMHCELTLDYTAETDENNDGSDIKNPDRV